MAWRVPVLIAAFLAPEPRPKTSAQVPSWLSALSRRKSDSSEGSHGVRLSGAGLRHHPSAKNSTMRGNSQSPDASNEIPFPCILRKDGVVVHVVGVR